jgi:hypothetical protein
MWSATFFALPTLFARRVFDAGHAGRQLPVESAENLAIMDKFLAPRRTPSNIERLIFWHYLPNDP